MQTATDALLTGVIALPDGRLVVHGLAGTLLVSDDRGRTFDSIGLPGREGIADGLVASDDGLLLVDAQAERVLARGALVVRIDVHEDAVLGLVLHREVVEGDGDVRLGARVDAGRQQGRDARGIRPVGDLEHRPAHDVAGAHLRPRGLDERGIVRIGAQVASGDVEEC